MYINAKDMSPLLISCVDSEYFSSCRIQLGDKIKTKDKEYHECSRNKQTTPQPGSPHKGPKTRRFAFSGPVTAIKAGFDVI